MECLPLLIPWAHLKAEPVQPVARVEAPTLQDSPAKPKPVRVKVQKQITPPPSMNTTEISDMWNRLPRHIQILVGQHPREVAQNSYKQFIKTREELVASLLDPTISLEEAARILNVCPTTVRRYTNRGALKHLRTVGNQRRFRLSDVLAFLESSTRPNVQSEEASN